MTDDVPPSVLATGPVRPAAAADPYDRWLDTSPQRSIYCRRWWLDAVAPNAYEILTIEEGGEIRAAWPITFQEISGHRVVAMPPLTQKLGVLFAASPAKYAERLSQEHRLIEGLIERLPARTFVSHHFHETFTNWLPFHWHGFQQTTRYTYLLPSLADVDAIWNALRKAARTTIRNGEKHGLRVRDATDVGEVFSLYARTMARQGLPLPYTQAQLERLDAACVANAGRQALIAEDAQGRPHAGLYLVYDQDCAIYLMGGADPELRQSGAQTVLLWEAIRFASSRSRQFDFEGSMIRGVEAALRDLGGIQTPYFRIWREADFDRVAPTPASGVRGLAGRALRKVARIVDRQ